MRAVLGKDPTRAPQSELNLPPGFRFCPTDEELVVHYLCRKAACEPFAVPIIAEVELYKFNPWDLPAKALFGEREWYFFSPRDRKYPNGSRPNRAAGGGYWKATGTDKPISSCGGKKKVGVKKALVFYKGKAPRGLKTNWIMHEYRLADTGKSTYRPSATKKATLRLDDWVLCRIYKKSLSEANQGKDVSDSLDDVLVEQSESSTLDDVLAALTELDGPANAAQGEAEVDDADMTQFVGALETQNSRALLHNSLKELCYEPAASAYSEAGGRRDDAEEIEGGGRLESSSGGSGEADACSFVRPERAVTPESFIRPQSAAMQEAIAPIRQSSPPQQSWHTTEKQEGEETAMERSLHELAHLPLTQLLNTAINTQNLGMASSSIFGIDLGLPSPCTLLAQGAAFGANLSMDPDNFLFLSPRLTAGEPCKSCF